MPNVSDAWDAIFLGCFVFGLLFSVISLVIGDVGHHLGDAGGHHAGDTGLPINISTILAFISWFGGVALLARQGAGWPALISLIVGIGGGLIGAAIIGWFLLKVVAPNDRALDPRDFELPGTIARVTSSIRSGGIGEVVYEQRGVRQVAAAKSADGVAIGRGDEVVVLRIEKGVALVERSATFFGNDLIEPDEAAIHPLSSGGRR